MQGFNKYYPPDYDPSHGSLNAYRGKHALGDRARKLDQGILITRFELPFNIWCGTCNNHIGMGVRYNAEKKKIGSYYSTPIYSFRCKCHLCDAWFEIQTDPKNTRYVVTSGARRKEEDWNPEENGGFAVHDTDGPTLPQDPLAILEKTADAQNNLLSIQAPRLESLQSMSEHYNSDPYSLSSKIRKRFREDKKVEQRKQKSDNLIKTRYGLPAELTLIEEDESLKREAGEEWARGQLELAAGDLEKLKRRKLAMDNLSIPSSSKRAAHSVSQPPSKGIDSLRARILDNTARQKDPFGRAQLSVSKDSRR